MDYDEPHLMPNEKCGPSNGQNSQLSALVAIGSL